MAQIEWHVGEEDYPTTLPDRAQQNIRSTVGVLDEHRLVRYVLRLCTLLSVGLSIAGGAAVNAEQQAHLAMQRTRHEILALEGASSTIPVRLIPPDNAQISWHDDWLDGWPHGVSSADTPTRQLTDLTVLGDRAIATALVVNPTDEFWQQGAYYEKHFYQYTSQGWTHATLTPAIWGKQESLATAHLRFEYYELDKHTVRAIAEQMDAAYVTLYRLLDLDLSQNHETLTFWVVPDDVTSLISVGYQQKVTSPMVARVPVDYTDTDFVAQLIVERMTYMAAREAVSLTGKPYQYRWERMSWALNGWLQQELLGRRTLWHQQARNLFYTTGNAALPAHLGDIIDLDMNEWPARNDMMRHYMSAESVVAYIADEFGRDRLAILARGFGVHSTWADLIPAVLGVSVAEFEAGWNRHLQNQRLEFGD